MPPIKVIPFLTRPVTNIARLSDAVRAKRAQTLLEHGEYGAPLSRLTMSDEAPIRQYYRSKTNIPMLEGEWDEDSDDEVAGDLWRFKMGEDLIDEFNDVSDKEKSFFKLWNRYISDGSSVVVADRSLPAKCMDFVRRHGDTISMFGLRQNLFLHLCNLWDEEIIASEHILTIMAFYDDRHQDDGEVREPKVICEPKVRGNLQETTEREKLNSGRKRRRTSGLMAGSKSPKQTRAQMRRSGDRPPSGSSSASAKAMAPVPGRNLMRSFEM